MIGAAQRHVPRVYAPLSLTVGSSIGLTASQSHHLVSVLRLASGSDVRLFNPTSGEYAAHLHHTGRASSAVSAIVYSRVRAGLDPQQSTAIVSVDVKGTLRGPLLLAPLLRNKDAMQVMIEKAVECGAGAILPLSPERAQHVNVHGKGVGKPTKADASEEKTSAVCMLGIEHEDLQARFLQGLQACGIGPGGNLQGLDKLQSWCTSAAEQCGRLDVPPVLARSMTLREALRWWHADTRVLHVSGRLLVCQPRPPSAQHEEGDGGKMLSVMEEMAAVRRRVDAGAGAGPVALAVGPEGGWSASEVHAVQAASEACAEHVGTRTVAWAHLGSRTLRAETAAIAAMVQAACALEPS